MRNWTSRWGCQSESSECLHCAKRKDRRPIRAGRGRRGAELALAVFFGHPSMRMNKRLHCLHGWNLDGFHVGEAESGLIRNERTGGRMNGDMGRNLELHRIRAAHGMAAIFLLVALLSGKGWCGSLAITSDPPGAHVFINGTDLGRTTPAAIRIRNLPVGRTVISVEKEGYVSDPPSQEVIVEWSDGNIMFTWWPPVLIKNLAGNRWRGITTPRSRRLETFQLVSDAEPARSASQGSAIPPQGSNPAAAPKVDVAPEPKIAVRDVDRPSRGRGAKSSLSCTAHIEDDPALGDAILGNGDGRIQKGEAFDLVVVVANTSTSTLKNVECTVTLPTDKSIMAYGDLRHAAPEIGPNAAVTNRINMSVPLSAKPVGFPRCFIDVKEAGTDVAEQLNYLLPLDRS